MNSLARLGRFRRGVADRLEAAHSPSLNSFRSGYCPLVPVRVWKQDVGRGQPGEWKTPI